jgi:hypothetical protein
VALLELGERALGLLQLLGGLRVLGRHWWEPSSWQVLRWGRVVNRRIHLGHVILRGHHLRGKHLRVAHRLLTHRWLHSMRILCRRLKVRIFVLFFFLVVHGGRDCFLLPSCCMLPLFRPVLVVGRY